MTLRKREDTEIWRRKHEFALSGELALEEAIILSQHRLANNGHSLNRLSQFIEHCLNRLS